MYKSKLQVLCQKNEWAFPDYTTVKLGPGHSLRFKSTVTVNGFSFESTGLAKQLKEAQNEAARLAYDHFTTSASVGTSNAAGGTPVVLQREFPITDPYQASQNNVFLMVQPLPITQETVQTIYNDGIPVTQQQQLPSGPETFRTPCSEEIPAVQQPPNRQEPLQNLHNVGDKTYKGSKDIQTFKNQLQIFAQKRSLPLPSYVSECEGPPHARRFKCKVMIDGKTYECMEFFNTVKEAEHATARIALQSLSPDGLQEESLIFYKNLLQEFTQKAGFHLPTYNTTGSGSSHNPTFIAHVEVEGQVFQGEESKTKKQAEMNAAKVAFLSLKDREMGQMPKLHSHNCQSVEALPVNSQSIVTTHSQESMKSEGPDVCTTKTRAKDEDVAVILPASNGVNGRCDSKQDTSSARKRDLSTLDSASVHLKDPSPPTSSLRLCDPSLPYFSASLVSAPNTNQPASSSSLVNKVRIFPFTPNMILPDGVIVCGDEKWVAVKSMPDQIRN